MKKIALLLVNFYRKFISPLFKPCCRFFPTCSEYSRQSFEKFGFFKGLYLTIRRICRCNPFSKGGIDYIPNEFHFIMKGNNSKKSL
ncbi:MAG: membrane protein insertion efficiency factor YidD [Oscillospiraceae bacterium]